MPPLFINSLSKILWYQRHEPDTFKSVARWSTYEDFLLERLGMPPVASHSVAARTMLMDIRAKAWSHEVLSAAGIDPAKLPALLPSGGIVGQLDPEIAEALGFVGETTVCSGGHDMVCAAVGAGLTADDTEAAVDIDGTMEGIVVCMKHANTSDVMFENRYPCYPGYDGYVTFSVNLTGSSMLKWFRDELSRDLVSEALEKEIDVYDLILKDLNPATPSGLLFLPQWSGSGNPYFDPNAKGMIYGLTLNTRRRDLAQGLIEGLCYDVNVQLEQFQRAGIKITKLLCVGGGSRSKSKLQMKANITGLEMINVPVIEASALGAAVMAAKGVGVLSEPLEAIKKAAPNQDRFVPSGAGRRQFAQSFQNYKELNRIKHEFENKS
jgi:xylulokinase